MTAGNDPHTTAPHALPSAGATWEDEHVLRAVHFDDIYFSRDNGVEEKRHVFLGGCGLPGAWQDADAYTVGELGFGTGLNFLLTWDAWRRTRKPGATLHYIAVEGFPLTRPEFADAQRGRSALAPLVDALVRVYPPPQAGFHRLVLRADKNDDPVFLTLACGGAAAVLAEMEARVDCWFLDGFAPDRNPAMWRAEVIAEIARLSHASNPHAEQGHASSATRVATYTVAGSVRRALSDAGFEVARIAGHGRKREMLQGVFAPVVVDDVSRKPGGPLAPWFAHAPPAPRTRRHAAIVGAGIAGCAAAYALQRRGWRVTLIDRHDDLAAEASGNPTAVIMPRITAAPSIEGRFGLAAWRFLLHTLGGLAAAGVDVGRETFGVLQLANASDEAARLAAFATSGMLPETHAIYADTAHADAIAGIALNAPGLFFPQAGVVASRLLCAALAGAADRMLATDIKALVHDPSHDGTLLLSNAQGVTRLKADVVILANGHGAGGFPMTNWMPLAARRGQLTFAAATPASAALRCVVNYGGYITPAAQGMHAVGATFDWVDNADAAQPVLDEDNARNLRELARVAPQLLSGTPAAATNGRAAIRCVTPDHLPVVGPLPDQTAYLSNYAHLRHGQHWVPYPPAAYHPGIYVLTGLGARGFTEAALAAEVLACHITGEPWPLERDLVTALHPGRFLVRALKRMRA
jgi:tRNA 5-methylaminomethyl-2-thiouridine biosynthesis bifunctional protein